MKKLVLYYFICSTLLSCASQNPANFPINPYDIVKVGIIPSKNKVELKRAVSEASIQMDDDYTDEIAENSNSTIDLFFKSKVIETSHLSALNYEDAKLVDTELENYFNKLTNSGKKNPNNFDAEGDLAIVKAIRVSDEFANILKKNNLRFAITSYTFGFTRTKKSERNRKIANVGRIALGVGMAVLTGYGLYGKDIPYHSTTYFFLVDAERQKLTMYNIEDSNIDPTDKNALSNQIFSGLGDYWYKK
jgi:hypothetical protein